MDEAESPHEGEKRRRRDDMEVQGEEEEEEEEEGKEECKQKVLQLLEEMRVFQAETLTAWGEALTQCACIFKGRPPEDSEEQEPSAITEVKSRVSPGPDVLSEHFHSVSEDLDNMMLKLRTIASKLEAELLQVYPRRGGGGQGGGGEEGRGGEGASGVDVHEASPQPANMTPHLSSCDPKLSESEHVAQRDRPSETEQTMDPAICSPKSVEEAGEEVEVKGQVRDAVECPSDLLEDTGETRDVEDKEEIKNEWVTVG